MSQLNSDEFYKLQYVEEGKDNLEQRHKIILSLLDGIMGNTALEIGCGSGVFARKAALKFNLKNIYGIDISSEAINTACKNGIIGTALNIDNNYLPFKDNFLIPLFAGKSSNIFLTPTIFLKKSTVF